MSRPASSSRPLPSHAGPVRVVFAAGRALPFIVGAALVLLAGVAWATTTLVSVSPRGPAVQQLAGRSGGDRTADRHVVDPHGGPCTGWIGALPNHELEVTAPMRLRISVEAPGDTTLVILRATGGRSGERNRPASVYRCNDDTNGMHPQVDATFEPGTYLVYVGSYNPIENVSYTMTIERMNRTGGP